MIRYRTGLDNRTGQLLRGFAHVRQSIDVILTTLLGERLMRPEFGFAGYRLVGENLSPAAVLGFYQALVPAVHRWEPEFRISRMEVVGLDRIGGLSLGYKGIYYPEGRLGNYAIREQAAGDYAIARSGA